MTPPFFIINMMITIVVLLFLCSIHPSWALSVDITRASILQALSSPSGKLTIAPEIVIPDPSDPTAILLQSNAVATLSQRVRVSKANAAWIAPGATLTSVATLAREQESARGSFPGPLPLIYSSSATLLDPSDLAEAGVMGVTVPVCGGLEITSIKQITSMAHGDEWTTKSYCQACLQCGIQPILEVTLAGSFAAIMSEDNVEQLVQQIAQATDIPPVAILLTMNPLASTEEEEEVNDTKEQQPPVVPLPSVPKKLAKTIPILGSVRITAGENRLGAESQRFSQAGFTGVVLRSDCVPGFRLNPDLDIVGQFWAACIHDLKSTRSKSFQFQSRNNMRKSVSAEWMKYQSNVIESGALGDPNDSYSVVNEAAGEYKGFA
jgi:hypothetical protein